MNLKKLFAFGALLGTIFGMAAAAAPSQAQGYKYISVKFPWLHVIDKDDPWISGDDEPYVIVTRFSAKMQLTNGTVTVVPGTLSVTTASGSHNNLGRSGDGWAESGHWYSLPSTLPINVGGYVPSGQPMYVVGAFVTLMEEDSFSSSTVSTLAEQIRLRVRNSLQTMTFSASAGTIADVLRDKIVQQITQGVKGLVKGDFWSISKLINGLLSAINPDDFGGVNLAFAVTGSNNTMSTYIGGIPQNAAQLLLGLQTTYGSRTSSIHFPTGDLSDLPSRARFGGSYDFTTVISIQ